jgi:hypothetical protein
MRRPSSLTVHLKALPRVLAIAVIMTAATALRHGYFIPTPVARRRFDGQWKN